MKLVRVGSCVGCGECCRTQDPFYKQPQKCLFYIDSVDGHCLIYENRLRECRDYPVSPRDLTFTPNCGYQFVDVESGKVVDAYMLESTGQHLVEAQKRLKVKA